MPDETSEQQPEPQIPAEAGSVNGTPEGDAESSDDAGVQEAPRGRGAPVQRPFPRRTIEDSLRVATAIRDTNGGNPFSPDSVAAALGMGKGSTFFYLTAASRDYGFTIGGRDAAEIKIADRGRRVVYPTSEEDRTLALLEAFFSVEVFKGVVEHFKGSKLPPEPFRTNILTGQFNLDPTVVEEFLDIFDKNCRYLGIGTDWRSEGSGAKTRPATVASPEVITVSGTGVETDGRPVCFVAMPFTERQDDHPIGFFDEVLRSIFTPAIEAAGFRVRTAKRQGSDVIQRTIVRELLAADMVLADLTEHNPNVLFELGMRITANKPVALVRATGTGGIFDVDHMLRVEDYNPNIWPSTVKGDVARLTAHLIAAWADKDEPETFFNILTRAI